MIFNFKKSTIILVGRLHLKESLDWNISNKIIYYVNKRMQLSIYLLCIGRNISSQITLTFAKDFCNPGRRGLQEHFNWPAS